MNSLTFRYKSKRNLMKEILVKNLTIDKASSKKFTQLRNITFRYKSKRNKIKGISQKLIIDNASCTNFKKLKAE